MFGEYTAAEYRLYGTNFAFPLFLIFSEIISPGVVSRDEAEGDFAALGNFVIHRSMYVMLVCPLSYSIGRRIILMTQVAINGNAGVYPNDPQSLPRPGRVPTRMEVWADQFKIKSAWFRGIISRVLTRLHASRLVPAILIERTSLVQVLHNPTLLNSLVAASRVILRMSNEIESATKPVSAIWTDARMPLPPDFATHDRYQSALSDVRSHIDIPDSLLRVAIRSGISTTNFTGSPQKLEKLVRCVAATYSVLSPPESYTTVDDQETFRRIYQMNAQKAAFLTSAGCLLPATGIAVMVIILPIWFSRGRNTNVQIWQNVVHIHSDNERLQGQTIVNFFPANGEEGKYIMFTAIVAVTLIYILLKLLGIV